MKLILQQEIDAYRHWRKSVLALSFLEILLLVVVAGLFVMTAIVSFTSTKGAVSLAALKKHLAALQPGLQHPATMDPKAEQERLEVLLNDLKATCAPADISGNKDLRALFDTTCTQIKEGWDRQKGNRSSWLQFRAVTNDFNDFYFR